MKLRPLTSSDEASALALWNRAAPFDAMTAPLFREKVGGDARIEQGCCLGAEADGRLAALIVAVPGQSAEGPRGYVKLLATAPEFARQGLATELLSRVERHFLAGGIPEVRFGESAPNYLTPGVDQRYSDSLRFLVHRGYEEVGRAVNMSVELADNPRLDDLLAERPPAGLEVRRAAPSDDKIIAEFLAQHWPGWQTEVATALASDPATLFLTLQEGVLLGFSAYECNNIGASWFGPMGTAPEARGRGIGRLLLARCLQAMTQLGFTQATIPWVGPTEFYAQAVGAKVSREFVRVRKLIG